MRFSKTVTPYNLSLGDYQRQRAAGWVVRPPLRLRWAALPLLAAAYANHPVCTHARTRPTLVESSLPSSFAQPSRKTQFADISLAARQRHALNQKYHAAYSCQVGHTVLIRWTK
eukprot:6084469-Pleurochrysis_carterae.AAC.1